MICLFSYHSQDFRKGMYLFTSVLNLTPLVHISFPVPASRFALKDVKKAPASNPMSACVILGGRQRTALYNVSVMDIVTARMKLPQTYALNVITIPR